MEVEKKPVKVIIGGEEYQVRGDAQSEMILKLADFINGKISEVREKTPQQPTSRLTVMAALNIAEELFREKEARQKLSQEYESQASQLLEWLDHKLAEVTA